jgi:ketosteroid isomerase-like protein
MNAEMLRSIRIAIADHHVVGRPPLEAVKAFIAAINAHDLAALGALMTDDHTFIDSGGTVVTGRDTMVSGWKSYYAMFPDYTIAAATIVQHCGVVAVFGTWAATYFVQGKLAPENRVGGPAAWKAQVETGRIKAWQVYADHTRTLEVMQRAVTGVIRPRCHAPQQSKTRKAMP